MLIPCPVKFILNPQSYLLKLHQLDYLPWYSCSYSTSFSWAHINFLKFIFSINCYIANNFAKISECFSRHFTYFSYMHFILVYSSFVKKEVKYHYAEDCCGGCSGIYFVCQLHVTLAYQLTSDLNEISFQAYLVLLKCQKRNYVKIIQPQKQAVLDHLTNWSFYLHFKTFDRQMNHYYFKDFQVAIILITVLSLQ